MKIKSIPGLSYAVDSTVICLGSYEVTYLPKFICQQHENPYPVLRHLGHGVFNAVMKN